MLRKHLILESNVIMNIKNVVKMCEMTFAEVSSAGGERVYYSAHN